LGFDEQIFLDELVFLQNLHSVGDACVLLPHEVDFAEGTSTDNLQDVEVIFRNLFGGLQQVLGGPIVVFFV